jgi:hypothetical protein
MAWSQGEDGGLETAGEEFMGKERSSLQPIEPRHADGISRELQAQIKLIRILFC